MGEVPQDSNVSGDKWISIESPSGQLTFGELTSEAETLARILKSNFVDTLALYADNGAPWIIVDLACQIAKITLLPLPLFFSNEQMRHAIGQAGAQAIISDRVIEAYEASDLNQIEHDSLDSHGLRLNLLKHSDSANVPPGTQKITFTSGSTGEPKGVCLSTEQQWSVAESLAEVVGINAVRHLVVLPLSTLLENIAGVYAPLFAGGTIVVPTLGDLGLPGSSGVNIKKLTSTISATQPHTMILVPELLAVLVAATRSGWQPPRSLKFLAVGGGKVSSETLRQAHACGLPVFEGYGLSESASVVSLNVPCANKQGSAGRLLPHVSVSVEDGEIVVEGTTFLGYTNDPESWAQRRVHTGDLGFIDRAGFVHIDGRCKNLLISSYGRNISPEWVESELLASPLLRQAVVIGDARPFCAALLWPHDASTPDEEIDSWLAVMNQRLPDYARIESWIRLFEPLSASNGLATENGKPKRDAIETRYLSEIESIYTPLQEALSKEVAYL